MTPRARRTRDETIGQRVDRRIEVIPNQHDAAHAEVDRIFRELGRIGIV